MSDEEVKTSSVAHNGNSSAVTTRAPFASIGNTFTMSQPVASIGNISNTVAMNAGQANTPAGIQV